MYYLHGLSFREYLSFKLNKRFEVIKYNELIDNPDVYNEQFSNFPSLLGHFKKYLTHGYYPFYLDDPMGFHDRLWRVVNKTIYEDISSYYQIKTENLHNFNDILQFIATIPPGTININNLAKHCAMDNKTVAHYLTILNTIGLITIIHPNKGGSTSIRKKMKGFISNTSLQNTITIMLGKKASIGSLRELFFIQCIQNIGMNVSYSTIGYYCINDLIFEIGGKHKKTKQLKQYAGRKLLVKDDIVTATKNIIPLFFFGFLQ